MIGEGIKEIETYEAPRTAVTEWTPKEVMQQVRMIQELMREGMQEGEHYGIIPGTNSKKPTLLKAGAEKLGLMFRLAPKFEIIDKDLGNGHREIQVKCALQHINTGKFWGEGVGSCSTMESKYRYRTGQGQSTGVKVPKEYWDLKRVDPKKAQEIIGIGYSVKKEDGVWWICEKIDKQENPDIADVYNTVLKMAKKRAIVDATLTATAASDIFTQDLEETVTEPPIGSKEPPKQEIKPENDAIEPVEQASGEVLSLSERTEIVALIKRKNVDREAFLAHLKASYGINGTAGILKKDYSAITEWIIRNGKESK